MNIQEKQFTEILTATKMIYEISSININDDSIECFIQLKSNDDIIVKRYFKKYTLSNFFDTDAFITAICTDIEITSVDI